MRDSTSSAGWILAYDSGGRVAYRAGGTTFTTALNTADVRDGWHHLALTVSNGATGLLSRRLARAQRHGRRDRRRDDAVARDAQRHGRRPVHARARGRGRGLRHGPGGGDGPRALPGGPRRQRHDGARGARRPARRPRGWAASISTGTTSPTPTSTATTSSAPRAPPGPFTRINASRLSASAYTDTSVTGGTTYVYAVTASDIANHRSLYSSQASATPPSTHGPVAHATRRSCATRRRRPTSPTRPRR